MTPARRKALEWVRDNGHMLELPDRYEPSRQMIARLEREDLITWDSGPMRDWRLSKKGELALNSNQPEQ